MIKALEGRALSPGMVFYDDKGLRYVKSAGPRVSYSRHSVVGDKITVSAHECSSGDFFRARYVSNVYISGSRWGNGR